MEHTPKETLVLDDSFVGLDKDGNDENDRNEKDKTINQATPSSEINVKFQFKLNSQSNEESHSPDLKTSLPVSKPKGNEKDYNNDPADIKKISDQFEHINENDCIGYDKSYQSDSHGLHQVSGSEPSDCETDIEFRHSEEKHPQVDENVTQILNSKINNVNMSFNNDPEDESKKDKHWVYNHYDLRKDNDQGIIDSGARTKTVKDDPDQNKRQWGYDNYTGEQSTPNIELEQCEQLTEDEDIRNIDFNDENKNDSDKHVEETYKGDTTDTQKVRLENKEHAYNAIHKKTQQEHNENLTKSISDENDETNEHSDEMIIRSKRVKDIQKGVCYEMDVRKKDKENKAILSDIEGENVEQNEISRIRLHLNQHENGEFVAMKPSDSQKLKTEITKSTNNQFYVEEDEHNPQKCHSNDDEGNTQICVSLDDGMDQKQLKDGDVEKTTSPREKLFQTSLETMGTETNQKSAVVKQKAITDGLHNNIEIDKLDENGEFAAMKSGDSQRIKTEMTKSTNNQFYVQEDEHNPQKCHRNDDEGNSQILVKNGGQLINATTSPANHEFQITDGIGREETKSSEREGIEYYTKQESINETTIKESDLVTSVEKVEGHKSSASLDDDIDQKKLKDCDVEKTTIPREKQFQASLETTGIETNQKSVVVKQNEITDGLQNNIETDKIHENREFAAMKPGDSQKLITEMTKSTNNQFYIQEDEHNPQKCHSNDDEGNTHILVQYGGQLINDTTSPSNHEFQIPDGIAREETESSEREGLEYYTKRESFNETTIKESDLVTSVENVRGHKAAASLDDGMDQKKLMDGDVKKTTGPREKQFQTSLETTGTETNQKSVVVKHKEITDGLQNNIETDKIHENREFAAMKPGDSQKLTTEMTKSTNNQFYIQEDEHNPQKCHSNDDEGNTHILVQYGGQLINVTTSPSNHEFQIPDIIAREETESSEREGLEYYTKRESFNETTIKESDLVTSVENVGGHKAVASLDDGIDQKKLMDGDVEKTTGPREKQFQTSLETTGTETNQKSVVVKQKEITDGLQNNIETDKIHVNREFAAMKPGDSQILITEMTKSTNNQFYIQEDEHNPQKCHCNDDEGNTQIIVQYGGQLINTTTSPSNHEFQIPDGITREETDASEGEGLEYYTKQESFNETTIKESDLVTYVENVGGHKSAASLDDSMDQKKLKDGDVEKTTGPGKNYFQTSLETTGTETNQKSVVVKQKEITDGLQNNIERDKIHENGEFAAITSGDSQTLKTEMPKSTNNQFYVQEDEHNPPKSHGNDDEGTTQILVKNGGQLNNATASPSNHEFQKPDGIAREETESSERKGLEYYTKQKSFNDTTIKESDLVTSVEKVECHKSAASLDDGMDQKKIKDGDVEKTTNPREKQFQTSLETRGTETNQKSVVVKQKDITDRLQNNIETDKILENGEFAAMKQGDSQKLKTEMTKSTNNQIYFQEDEHNPQKCHSNDDERNTQIIVQYGGQLIDATTSPSNHEFQIPDGIAREETESSEREGLEYYTKQESFNETTIKESNLVTSVEKVEGHKSAACLDDGIDPNKLKDGDVEKTTSPREKHFQDSLEITGTETNQKLFVVKQKEITDGLQNNIETDKIPVVIESEYGQVRLIKVGKFYLISINGKKSKLPKSVSQDTNLRLENIGNDILLFTKTICYRVRIEQDKIVLENVSDKSRPSLPSSESHNAKQISANELKISNGKEREHKEGPIESEKKSNDVQNDINEQCRFETDEKDTSDSRSEMTQNESSSNQGSGEKTMKLQDEFKDIKLIKVGKFWLISVNERKSKLSKTINQDPTLRIEVDGMDLLLLSDTCCYKIKNSANNIKLEEYKSYFKRALNENLSGCTNTDFTTDQTCGHSDRSFDIFKQDEKCTESSDREFKEHTELIRKCSCDIETEEDTSTNNDRARLPFDDRNHVGVNLAKINSNLNNGENENQNDISMTNTLEIATDARKEKYCQDLPESESKETDSQDGIEYKTHDLESMNLNNKKETGATQSGQCVHAAVLYTREKYKETDTIRYQPSIENCLEDLRPPAKHVPGKIRETTQAESYVHTKVEKTVLGVKIEQRFEYRIEENEVTESFSIEFTIEEFIRWVFFLNSPTKRKICSQIQINQTVIELEIRPELCKVLTPLKSSMQILTVICHLKSQVMCSTTDVIINNITETYGTMSTETLKRITEVKEEGIFVKIVEESIFCAYLSSFEANAHDIIESIVQAKHVKSPIVESDAGAKKVTCTISLTGYLPWTDIFERFDLTNKLRQKLQHVHVQIAKHTCGIAVTFNGFESEVEKAKHFIQCDFANCIKRHEMKLAIINTEVFHETKLCSLITEQLHRTVLLKLENKKAVLYYLNDESLRQAVTLISSQIKEEEIILMGNWRSEDAISYLRNEYNNSKNGCLLLVNKQRTKVIITGWKPTVSEIVQQIQQQQKENPKFMESNRTKSKTRFITEEIRKTRTRQYLEPVQLWSALFERFNISTVLKKTANSQDILIHREEKRDELGKLVFELIIEGQEADVKRLMELFEDDFVGKLNKERPNLTEKMTKVLLHSSVKESVERRFPDVLFNVNKDLVVELYAFNREICQDTAKNVRKLFAEDKFVLGSERVNKEAVHTSLERFQKESEGVYLRLDEKDNTIIVSGLKDEVKRVINELSQVSLAWYAAFTKVAVENTEHFSVLQLDSHFLDQLKKAFDVDITHIEQTDAQGFLIHGNASKIELCQREIEDYQSSILTESIETDTTEEAVLTQEFQVTVDGISDHPLSIEIQMEFTSKFVYTDENKEEKVWIFPNGQRLCLLNKDAIFPDACFDVEVVETSDNRGQFDRHSTGGKITVTLHQPYFNKNDDNPLQRTKEIIKEILGVASKNNEEAISFQIPKLKRWSHDNLMKCWMTAFTEYFMAADKSCSLRFILLCATKAEFAVCLNPFKTKMVQLAHEQVHAASSTTKKEEFNIKVVRGKLNDIEADVLVNTTSLNLDLSKGTVSNAILKTAGAQLQTEINRNYPNGIKPLEIAVTKGYGLACKTVYHGALQVYNLNKRDELKRDFQMFMQNCLYMASKWNYQSIAFPAIGTGNLRYPLDFVVNEMFENVKQFKQTNPNTTLVEVLIVIFPGDFIACEAFAKVQRLEDVGGAKHKNLTKQKNPCHFKIRVTGHKKNTEKAMRMVCKQLKLETQSMDLTSIAYADALNFPKYLIRPKKQHESTGESLPEARHILDAFKCETMEGLIVRVYNEDILHVPVDCIVNPANETLRHFAGLAGAIAKAAGDDLIVESNCHVHRIGPVATGSAVRTTAGKLNYKCIIHAVGPNWNDYSPYTEKDVMTCQEDLKQAIVASLDIAAQSEMSTIAIPAVSSALFGVPKELCVMQYVKAVQQFSARKRNSTTLKEVHFVDLDNTVIGLIKQAYTEMLINKVPCPWNWKVYVKSEPSALVGGRHRSSKHDDDLYASVPCFTENKNNLTCKFTQIRMVTISQEDIFSFKQMDAIVCSEDPSGSAAGRVARSLLRKGGKTYEQEKKKHYQMKRPQTGEVLITGGGKTGYMHVIHAIMPIRTHFAVDERGRAEWTKALQDMINTIFDTAEKRVFKTMVMSLLGTGAGNSDPKQCASVLLDSFTISCSRYHRSPFVLAIVNNDSGRNRIVADLFKDYIIDSHRYLAPTTTDESKCYNKNNQGADGKNSSPGQKEKKREESQCVICIDRLTHPKTLTCGHTFCSRCIDKAFEIKPVCPSCGTVCGILKGDQPDGDMTIEIIGLSLAEYTYSDTIRITYSFDGGKQQQSHPCPGKAYTGIKRIAYLPNNKEGREVLLLLKLAFERRLTFTIGASTTTGREGVITWNDIHHKTNPNQSTQFGYPDPLYFNRVKEELTVKGVTSTDPDLDMQLLKKLDKLKCAVIPVKAYRPGGIFRPRVY